MTDGVATVPGLDGAGGGVGAGGPGRRVWLRRGAVLLAAALAAALSYAWALGADPLEPYHAAAVRSMSLSWHNFAYGAFDPAAP